MFAAANHMPEQTKELLGLVALAVVLGGALVFACIARLALPHDASAGSRQLANIAIVLPLAWGAAIVAFIAYVLSRV
jgi:hypothetical protein